MRDRAPHSRTRTRDLLLPQRRPLSRTPSPLKCRSLNQLRAGKGHRPLRFATEPKSQELPEVVTPVRPIIPQHVTVVEHFDLPNSVLVGGYLQVADKLAPPCRYEVEAEATSGSLEVQHQ